jgi:hypothetical protein
MIPRVHSTQFPALTIAFGLCSLFVFPLVASTFPGDEHWAATFGAPGTTNRVYALAVRGEHVYASGYWGDPAVSTVNWIEHWDGERWSRLPGVFKGSMPIEDCLFIGDDIYVCGLFDQIDSTPVKGIARWNGQTWSAVGDVSGVAFRLETDGTNLYVGGVFTNISGVLVTNVAQWNGQIWSPLGDGLGFGASFLSDFVDALKWNDGALYAGGAFTNSGNLMLRNLARWDGFAWREAGGSPDGTVYALASDQDKLYAGGEFKNVGATPALGIAVWNGTEWGPLGTGLIGNDPVTGPGTGHGPVFAIGVSGSNVIVGGTFTNAGGLRAVRIARWDGNSWSSIGGINGSVLTIRVSGTNVYVGGIFTQADDYFVNHITRWDGIRFNPLGPLGFSEGSALPLGFVRSLAAGNGCLYAGGIFTGIGRARANGIARWNGIDWSALGQGVKGTNSGNGTTVTAISVDAASGLYAGGVFTNAGGIAANNIAHWDGTNWSPLGNGVSGRVSAIAVRGSNIFAGGTFSIPRTDISNIAMWNGGSWSRLSGTTRSNSSVNAILVAGDDLYVGGNFVAGEGASWSTNIAKHNGATWVPLETGANDTVRSIARIGTAIYIGGSFTKAGGNPLNHVAKWEGNSWSPLGSGLSFSVYALTTIGTDLYAAGDMGGFSKWNGISWSALGGGVGSDFISPIITGLASVGSDVYLAGSFDSAGTKRSYFIAQWNESRNFDLLPSLELAFPSRLSSTGFQFSVVARGINSYSVERSTSLSSWALVQTNSTGSVVIKDTNALDSGNPIQIYRARASGL